MLVTGEHRHRVRRAPGLLLEELRKGARLEVPFGPRPFLEQLLALGEAQQRQLRQRRPGIPHHAGEHGAPGLFQPPDGGGVEQSGAVPDVTRNFVVLLLEHQLEIELRLVVAGGDPTHRQIPQPRRQVGQVVQHHQDLEERRVAQAALDVHRLEQLFERQLLVGVGGQRRAPHPRQVVAHARLP